MFQCDYQCYFSIYDPLVLLLMVVMVKVLLMVFVLDVIVIL